VPVIIGEARTRKTLEEANLKEARSVILATDDDLANIDAALTAREIKPDIRVVMRLFDDARARKLAHAFQLTAISTSHVCAPAFAAAATGRNVLHAFQIEGQLLHVADLVVDHLAGQKLGDIEKQNDVSIVLHRRPGEAKKDFLPKHENQLAKGDTLVVMSDLEHIQRLEGVNRTGAAR
jgi:Trk K+ transport system NAD-binding subunit